jgi:hypothetical protein
MQSYFLSLLLDHLASKFELFLAQWYFEYQRFSPIEADLEMLYPIEAPHYPRAT